MSRRKRRTTGKVTCAHALPAGELVIRDRADLRRAIARAADSTRINEGTAPIGGGASIRVFLPAEMTKEQAQMAVRQLVSLALALAEANDLELAEADDLDTVSPEEMTP